MKHQFRKDIEAEITFFPPENGGRVTPLSSGARPPFLYDNEMWIATIWTENEEIILIGPPISVFFEFFSPKAHLGKLIPGKEFELWDGRVIAQGHVTRIIGLERSADLEK